MGEGSREKDKGRDILDSVFTDPSVSFLEEHFEKGVTSFPVSSTNYQPV